MISSIGVYISIDGIANLGNFHPLAGFLPIATDLPKHPNCPLKHKDKLRLRNWILFYL